jgi:NAD+ kinase
VGEKSTPVTRAPARQGDGVAPEVALQVHDVEPRHPAATGREVEGLALVVVERVGARDDRVEVVEPVASGAVEGGEGLPEGQVPQLHLDLPSLGAGARPVVSTMARRSEVRVSEVLFTAFSNRPDALALAREAVSHLEGRGTAARVHLLGADGAPELSEDSLLVSLGGDGTFLKAARLAHQAGARVLPVNLGRVGFLLTVPSGQLIEAVEAAQRDRAVVERLALQFGGSARLEDDFAFNEVVVERSLTGHMVRLRTFVEADQYLTYTADGVMVATPTGSTGYNFSAGGPVVDASLQVMMITPIAPHFTIDRSFVVGAERTIRLVADDVPAAIVADGQVVGTLEPGEVLEVRRNPRPVRVVATSGVQLGFRLRESLREGHA